MSKFIALSEERLIEARRYNNAARVLRKQLDDGIITENEYNDELSQEKKYHEAFYECLERRISLLSDKDILESNDHMPSDPSVSVDGNLFRVHSFFYKEMVKRNLV